MVKLPLIEKPVTFEMTLGSRGKNSHFEPIAKVYPRVLIV